MRLVEVNSVVRDMRMFCLGGAGRRSGAVGPAEEIPTVDCDWDLFVQLEQNQSDGRYQGH